MSGAPTPLVIVGAGGHGREILDIVDAVNAAATASGPGRRFDVLGFLDDGEPDREVLDRRGVALLGPLERLPSLGARYVIGIGSPAARRAVDEKATALGGEPVQLVHPSATVGSLVRLGPGAVLWAHASVTTNVTIGRHAHLNQQCTVAHDAVVGDYVTVAPGANVSGNVVIGDGAWFGTNASAIQGVRIGPGAVVGAGAAVVADVPAGATAVGVPARPR